MAWLVAAMVAVAGCGGDSRNPAAPDDKTGTPGEGLWEGKVDAVVADGRVTLKNGTERVIGYLVVEKNMAIVALFPPCTTDCKTLVQGAEVSISYQDIPGYSPGATEAIVYWWTYGSDGRAEGGMKSENVRL
jgi:hypothetical protein